MYGFVRRFTTSGETLRDFVRPDGEAIQGVRAEGGGDGYVHCVTAARDQHSSNAGNVVARIEGMPRAANIDFHPRREIHDTVGRRNADIAQVAGAIARGNIHASAECDGEVREVAADSRTLVERLPSGPRGARTLIIEGDVVVDKIANSLNARPARLGQSEERPGRIGQPIRLAVTAAQQEDQG